MLKALTQPLMTPLVQAMSGYEAAAESSETDPNFASVSLLIQSEGPDGSTSFTDSSTNNLTVNPVGASEHSNNITAKFGDTSMYMPEGAANYCLNNTRTVLDLSSGDWTIEGWFYIPSTTLEVNLFSVGVANYKTIYLSHKTSYGFQFLASTNGTSWDISNYPSAMSYDAWHHVAVTRDGSDFKIWLDGAQTGTTMTNASNVYLGTDYATKVGAHYSNNGGDDVYNEEFRITKGVARYTGSFSVPTAVFPNS